MDEKAGEFIESLYRRKETLTKDEFVRLTEWKDFIPVVDDDVARFLRLVLAMKKPKRILEIGTSIGYSATNMALAAREYGGRIITLENDPKAAAQARENFRRAGVDSVAAVREGDALYLLPALGSGSFDLVFQDADKRLYSRLLPECIRVLAPGGIFLADDALFPAMDLDEKWQDLVAPMEKFDRQVAASPELVSTLLPIGDGLICAVKKD
ncbi:O-methyltransferase [Caproiciproducens sp. NJN-50]|uniref:O-methyltransferase n=1 Tax=Acutalibacteraceae TaxID=3082771 RepID=UPI000FFE038B|nr:MULTISPECIES: O-methyltransferase [Acutalibacteraceae]QAT48308.1 O-methyltransferase [Caproiciproducens sp. NJN-50]